MSSQEVFYAFVDFDFQENLIITHNHDGYSAAYSKENIIVIWKNETSGPNISEGRIISIIIGKFDHIDQFQWVHDTNDLLIRDGDRIHIWDIFSNKQKDLYLTTDPILYAKKISIGLLIVKINGKFSLITKNREITSQLTSDLVLDIDDGVLIYPNLFKVDEEGNWVEIDIKMSLSGRFIRRRFESNNQIQINGDLIHIGEEELGDLLIPYPYRRFFEDAGLVIISPIKNYYMIKSREYTLFTKIPEPGHRLEGVLLPSKYQVFATNHENQYISRSSTEEEKIILKNDVLLHEVLNIHFSSESLNLTNMPLSFLISTNQKREYVRYNKKYGLLWYPDLSSDYLFLDLYYQRGAFFQKFGRDKREYILINKEGTDILRWLRGENYPSGKLLHYEVNNPDNEPEILYDVDMPSKRITEEEFKQSNNSKVEFPLILSEWHKINLLLRSTSDEYYHELSYSQYFLLMERLSKSENAALLDYPSDIPEKAAFLNFGHLKIELQDRVISFENIAPEWSFNQQTGLLAYYAIDKYCYVINTFDNFLLPIYSFQTNLPYSIHFSDSGQLLIYICFELRETEIITHPSDGKNKLNTKFPYMTVEIHDIFRKKSRKRSVRLPMLLEYDNIEVNEVNNRIYIFYPCYTNNQEESVLMYDIRKKTYHQSSGTQYYRLWMTHSKNSPFNRINKGAEFPVETHPEISRDHAMRPFEIFDGVLIRKEDNLPISLVDVTLEQIPQHSTSNIYDLEDTESIKVPFYYTDSLKEIYLDKSKLDGLKLKDFYVLDKVPSHLEIETFNLEKIPRNNNIKNRISSFLKYLLDNRIKHDVNGISYEDPDYPKYEKFIQTLLKENKLS